MLRRFRHILLGYSWTGMIDILQNISSPQLWFDTVIGMLGIKNQNKKNKKAGNYL